MKAWGSKKIIRREDVPELTPWQVDQFSGASIQRPHALVPEAQVVPSEPEPMAEVEPIESAVEEPAAELVPMVAADELERIRSEAHEAAYRAGYEEGMRQGRDDGEAAGREAGQAAGFEAGQQAGRQTGMDEVERFRGLADQLAAAVAGYEARLAEPIRDIAVAVARQVLRSSLSVEPERVLSVIREAINSLPELHGPLRVELHPDDLALVKSLLAEEGAAVQWRFEPVTDIERGGCRIAHATVELDLTLPTRWRRVVAALGSHEPWQAADDEQA
ncbi:flagellar assembly protein FliH [Chitinimonas sp.]|uniref:flagellar assembly protein FliH n=1 Tax=Chitinimonas sp. TaxID=1934313 RepID=UPI002F93CCE8